MKTLLRIDASIRTDGSYSRSMGDFLEQRWKKKYTHGNVIYRDLRILDIPDLHQELTTAFFAKDREVAILDLSNALVDEIKASDYLLITCPMYNLMIPSRLKAYIDHIVRVNETFRYTEEGTHQGLLVNKKAFVITARGGQKDPTEHIDIFGRYLTDILAFMGISHSYLFEIEGTANPLTTPTNLASIYQEIKTALI
ncbi:FMN-dependent NADH-azoreductase [Sphingobacterium alkalisoli]|uniref:FMN dependent NADH:quinone oxidoreductase n=1 Tax=Sphingobacterium alkalisoli TaxID=1874115 RepID=A0A4U0H7P1_9SPHI|nr:NAD(P)H-dependent oxidoreductase [Sphingobacterium alkalisoli]TJY67728.1 FMN-dependent NADH-azoreductase [Sphingobacterium alkalisoli]GGH11741.1 FMN-dependent NADH-azoreductase [Sphingobacterium alkalisoli]